MARVLGLLLFLGILCLTSVRVHQCKAHHIDTPEQAIAIVKKNIDYFEHTTLAEDHIKKTKAYFLESGKESGWNVRKHGYFFANYEVYFDYEIKLDQHYPALLDIGRKTVVDMYLVCTVPDCGTFYPRGMCVTGG